MASRFAPAPGGPSTTNAGAFFNNQQRPGFMRLASDHNGGPSPQQSPVRTRQGSLGGQQPRPILPPNGQMPVRQASSGGMSSSQHGSSGSLKRPDRKDTRDVAWVHWRALKEFLAAWADKESPTARASARDKLTRLTRLQFLELSTDVYDELMRRLNVERGGPEVAAPFLPVRDDFHPKRNQARQKLATLPKNRFKDLASDVFYELRRRYPEFDDEPTSVYGADTDAGSVAGGQQRSDSRSASRSAVSLHDRKGSSLSSAGGQRFATPTAATSDIVVPNKSTITEEAIEVPYARDSVMDTTHVETPRVTAGFRTETPIDMRRKNSKEEVTSPRTTEENGPGWHERDSFISNTTSRSKAAADGDAENVRREYELRVAGLERKVHDLEAEKDELSRQLREQTERRREYEDEVRGLKERATTHASSLRSIQHELDVARDAHDALREQSESSAQKSSSDVATWRSRASELEVQLQMLQEEHAECAATTTRSAADESVVAELQGEVKSLVEELNSLSVQNEELVMTADRQRSEYSSLEAELAELRKQFNAVRTELRNVKATSVMFTSQPLSDDHMPASPDGNIADMHVSSFQSAIDNLLTVARSSQPTGVLPAMKAIVEAVTAIGEDVRQFEDAPNLDVDVNRLESLKHDSTTRLGALMTAARNHAMASGLSPVGLIDAAAGTLSANVVEIIKLLKIRRTGAAREILKKRGSLSIQEMVRRTPFDERDEHAESGERGQLEPVSPRPSPGPQVNGNGSVNGHGSVNGNGSANGYAPVSPRPAPGSALRSPQPQAMPKYETPAFQTLGAADARVKSFQSGSSAQRSDSFDLERKHSSSASSAFEPASPPLRSPTDTSRQPLAPHPHDPNTFVNAADVDGDREWDDVKPYLNTQSAALVSSIQSLLAAIRTGDQGQTLNQHLSEVIAISSSIVGVTRNAIPRNLQARGDELLRALVANTNRLAQCQDNSCNGEQFDKQLRQEIANYSFGVAKSLKALMKLGAE